MVGSVGNDSSQRNATTGSGQLTAAQSGRLGGMKLLPIFIFCGYLYGETKPVTLTGWFSDEGCARGRVASGSISPTNPDCAKKCLDKGVRAVFISEQGKEMLIVTGYEKARDDMGYHLEITGIPDVAAKSFSVQSVKRIGEYQGPSCSRPKK
jgi:hypothetical protein